MLRDMGGINVRKTPRTHAGADRGALKRRRTCRRGINTGDNRRTSRQAGVEVPKETDLWGNFWTSRKGGKIYDLVRKTRSKKGQKTKKKGDRP